MTPNDTGTTYIRSQHLCCDSSLLHILPSIHLFDIEYQFPLKLTNSSPHHKEPTIPERYLEKSVLTFRHPSQFLRNRDDAPHISRPVSFGRFINSSSSPTTSPSQPSPPSSPYGKWRGNEASRGSSGYEGERAAVLGSDDEHDAAGHGVRGGGERDGKA